MPVSLQEAIQDIDDDYEIGLSEGHSEEDVRKALIAYSNMALKEHDNSNDESIEIGEIYEKKTRNTSDSED